MVSNVKGKPILLLFHTIFLFLVVDSGCTERKYDSSKMEARFKSWLKRHEKDYKNKEEWMLRFGIYQANLNFINYINAQNLSYELGDNRFADLTNEEYKALYVGRSILPPASNHSGGSASPEPQAKEQAPAPAEVDWRKKGAVTAIKDQGQCGIVFHFYVSLTHCFR